MQRAVLDQGRVAVRRLPAAQDMLLELHCVRERVHREAVLGCALDAEEGDPGPDPEDEVVVVDGRHLVELDTPTLEIDRGRGRLMDGGVRLIVKQVAQRMGDL